MSSSAADASDVDMAIGKRNGVIQQSRLALDADVFFARPTVASNTRHDDPHFPVAAAILSDSPPPKMGANGSFYLPLSADDEAGSRMVLRYGRAN